MALPTGLDPNGLVPIIIISDRLGVEKYRFEHPLAVSSGTAKQDINLSGYFLQGGIAAEHGFLNLQIEDQNNILTDSSLRNRDILIKPQWEVEAWFFRAGNAGNPAANTVKASLPAAKKWYKGLVFDPELNRPMNNYQQVNIFSVGIGVRYSDRLTSMKRTQARAANGLDLDATDTTANASEIAKDLILKTDHFPHPGLTQESFTANRVVTFTTKFADFQKHFNTINNALNEVANRTGQIWGVDPATEEIFMHIRGTVDSGLLITNNLTPLLTTTWDKTKLCIARNRPMGFRNTTSGWGFSMLHGIGGLSDQLDHNDTPANASLDLSTHDSFAFPFIPTNDSVSKISAFLTLPSSTTTPLHMCIVGNDSAVPEPRDVADLRRRLDIQPGILNDKVTPGGIYFEQNFRTINESTPVEPDSTFYLLIDKHPDIRIDYQTGTGTIYRKTGGSWGSIIGEAKFRTYHSRALNVIIENIVSRKSFGTREMSLPLNDFPNEQSAIDGMVGFSRSIGKTKRMYKPIFATPPDERPTLGSTARLVDKFNGMDTFVDLVGFNMQSTSFSRTNRGADMITFFVEDLFY